MSLTLGTRLGVYEVLAAIGQGGMGEVYRARDTTLDRDVAIKVLPEAFAHDPERVARFQREAKTLAALNHPNIGGIYGVEETAGVMALVLELVEGSTLADLLRSRGGGSGRPSGLPINEALLIARQIAEALEAAHEHGIIHRDLKPANIKVREDGTVKVLDFGLAKVLEPAAAGNPVESPALLTHSPTLSLAVTQAGVILGTAAYMSPEQANGKPADKRSDIWAFGCVLYEMLTGRRIFEGRDVAETLAALLMREPAWEALPPDTPPAVRRLLRRALVKERRERLADIADARLDVEDAATASRGSEAAPAIGTTLRGRALWVAGAGAVAGAAVTAAVAWSVLSPAPAPRSVTRFAITPEAGDVGDATRHVLALAPNGAHLVYGANQRLYVRPLDQVVATPIRATEAGGLTGSARAPFFSPDGQWIAFWQQGQLRKASISGGALSTLCTVGQIPFGASWGPDDTILFGQGPGGIWRVPGSGGTPEVVIAVDEGRTAHGPSLLPDRRTVIFTRGTVGSSWDEAEIVAHALDTGEEHVLINGGTDARYLPSGHLVFARAGSLLAVPFDVRTARVTGAAVPVLEGVLQAVQGGFGLGGASGAAQFAISTDGGLVYLPRERLQAEARVLVWVDRQGREELLPAEARTYYYPRVSPDGTRIALDIRDQENDIWIWDVGRTTMTRLTFAAGIDRTPAWTPDGRYVVFASNREGGLRLFRRAADGTGADERLATAVDLVVPTSLSPDGHRLVVMFRDAADIKSGDNLGLLAMDGDGGLTPLLRTPFNERNAEISPDGRWVAYQSNESGEDQIFVRPFPNVDAGRWQISSDGGTRPLWSRDGRELFYMNTAGGLMGVTVAARPAFAASTPVLLARGPYLGAGAVGVNDRTFDVSPDGKRFLVIKSSAASTFESTRFIFVQNWMEEVKRLVPVN